MNMISQIRASIVANGEVTITAEQFNQLQAEWITRCAADLPEHLKTEQQIIGMEKVVEKFGKFTHRDADLHEPFEVTPNQIYDLCDEVYGGDSQHIRRPEKPKQ